MTNRPDNKPARLKDVAKLAGVAPATVSRLMNGGITLPEGTARRIWDAAAALDYRPNPIARSLGRGKSDTVGLALPDLSNPFFGQLAAHLEIAAMAAGRSLILSSTMNSLEGELRTIERLERGYFDVLLFVTNRTDDGRLAEAINRNAGRIVLLDEDVPGTNVPKVFSDNRMGGRLAGQALAKAAHSRIVYIAGPERLMSTEERGAGLREGAPDAQIDVVHCADYTADCGRIGTEKALRLHPAVTGLFFGSDTLMLGGLATIRAAGLEIGRDVAIISFDDVEPLEFFNPPVPAIGHRMDELAMCSIQAAVAAMANVGSSATAQGPCRETLVPVRLVPRTGLALTVGATPTLINLPED